MDNSREKTRGNYHTMYVEAHRSGTSGESDTVVARLEGRQNGVRKRCPGGEKGLLGNWRRCDAIRSISVPDAPTVEKTGAKAEAAAEYIAM
jgi:hypothetical protein